MVEKRLRPIENFGKQQVETTVTRKYAFSRCVMLFVGMTTLLAFGCSSERVGMVEGVVTLDGKPLSKGAVRFSPVDGQAQTAGGAIENGTFAVEAKPAQYRVEISATEVQGLSGGRIDKFAPNDNLNVVSLIPEKYNTKSTLTIEVIPGLNEPQFNLESR